MMWYGATFYSQWMFTGALKYRRVNCAFKETNEKHVIKNFYSENVCRQKCPTMSFFMVIKAHYTFKSSLKLTMYVDITVN